MEARVTQSEEARLTRSEKDAEVTLQGLEPRVTQCEKDVLEVAEVLGTRVQKVMAFTKRLEGLDAQSSENSNLQGKLDELEQELSRHGARLRDLESCENFSLEAKMDDLDAQCGENYVLQDKLDELQQELSRYGARIESLES